jgi:AcrR family transcriptional regulator
MPRKVDYEARREAFLAAAGRLIRRNGLSGVTARAVAREAGYTTGALVHYVDSIDDLLLDAFEYAWRRTRARMVLAEAEPDPLISLRDILYLALPMDEDQLGSWTYWLGIRERAAQKTSARRLTHMSYANWLKRVEGVIRRAKSAGDTAANLDVPSAARAAVALVDGLGAQVLRSGRPPSPKAQRALIDDWIKLWLRPPRALPAVKS